jgi:L-alanine-DL-glutamate epimerase-like enolase superfamily enzyme
MAEAGAALVEDPWWLHPDDVFEQASAAMSVPIMVDYFCSGPRDAPVWLDRGARAFSVKPGRIGITEGLDMARLAHSGHADTVVGMFAETPIGTLHTLSFATACHSRFAAESSFFLMFKDSPLKEPLVVKGGTVRLPDESGFAPLVNWELVSKASTDR